MKENVYLASKPRYEILDGLRGVASVIVVLFHLLETYSAGPAYQVINHGYLAVDFFFVDFKQTFFDGCSQHWLCGFGTGEQHRFFYFGVVLWLLQPV